MARPRVQRSAEDASGDRVLAVIQQNRVQVEQEQNGDVESERAIEPIRGPKKRGPTLCLALFERKTMAYVEYNYLGNPTGPDEKVVNQLTTFIGVMARTSAFCPIQKPTWEDVPLDGKERAWTEIKTRFITNEEEVKECLLGKIAACWRGFKSDLKHRFYKPGSRQESIDALDDKRVDKEQWAPLVDFWESDEAQEESRRNRENRLKGKPRHALGRTSHPVLREKLIKRGKPSPDRCDVFIASYTRKDGTIHPSAVDIVEEVQKAKEAAASSGNDSTETTGYGDLLMQVVGPPRHGRLNCAGFGATMTNTWGPRKKARMSVRESESMRDEIDALKSQLADVPVLKERLDIALTELQTQREVNAQLQERTGKMLEMFTAIQAGFNCGTQ